MTVVHSSSLDAVFKLLRSHWQVFLKSFVTRFDSQNKPKSRLLNWKEYFWITWHKSSGSALPAPRPHVEVQALPAKWPSWACPALSRKAIWASNSPAGLWHIHLQPVQGWVLSLFSNTFQDLGSTLHPLYKPTLPRWTSHLKDMPWTPSFWIF